MKQQVWCDPEIDTELQGCRGIATGVLVSLVIWVMVLGCAWWVLS